jgi:hypothetical protein
MDVYEEGIPVMVYELAFKLLTTVVQKEDEEEFLYSSL